MLYVNLNVKTMYSILNSTIKINELIEKAKKDKHLALAITDENVMYGAIKFYEACKKNKLKPIIGITIDVESELASSSKIILLAKNNDGYKNILKISSAYQIRNKPVLYNDLRKYRNDVICVISTENNDIRQYVENNNIISAQSVFEKYKDIYNDLYVGVSSDYDKMLNTPFVNDNNIVSIHPTHCVEEEDKEVLRYLRAINKGKSIRDISPVNEAHFHTTSDILDFFKVNKCAINNTLKIANKCNVNIDFNTYHLPKYHTKDNICSKDYLHALCKKGLQKRLGELYKTEQNEYVSRLNYELKIIDKMGYNDYFLIVFDFVKYAKNRNILVGPGRGSAAGSLVSYVLGITNVDPIKYNLLLERFLNPERITLPDIDLDIQDNCRDEVIKYVQKKYGSFNVAHIVTFGTFASRSTIRDVARVMKFESKRVDEIIKYANSNNSISEILDNSTEIQTLINKLPEIEKLFSIALKIEGLPRHISTHAAGVIITENNLTEVTALQTGINNIYQTQYEASDLEKLGLLKIDFLGLRNLTTISRIIKSIEENLGKKINIDNIPLNDKKTYDLISTGNTTGVFQLESDGMRSVLVKMHANKFEDIVASNALYRPGPMDNIPTYIARKIGKEKINYIHPSLEGVLSPTYGIIVYQEQVMQIASIVAGYSYGEADLLRRAMSKKLTHVMEDERGKFIKGAKENGYNQETAVKLFDYIDKFASYGFNRSHSVAYSIVSYQLAYLKANYPLFFMSILLSSVIGSESQIAKYVSETKKYGINVLPPSINSSYLGFQVEEDNIRFGLLAVRNIGYNTGKAILETRGNEPFKTYHDFIRRTNNIINQRTFESLVNAGAFDEFSHTKKFLIENYNEMVEFLKFNVDGLLDDQMISNMKNKEYELKELMRRERDSIGLVLRSHPILRYKRSAKEKGYVLPSQIKSYIGEKVLCVGYIEKVRVIKTNKNEDMAFVELSDDKDIVEVVLFPDVYNRYKDNIINSIALINGNLQTRANKRQIVANIIKTFTVT